MKSVFIDESIHDRAGFIVVAAVVAGEDIQEKVEAALRECGFAPDHDEFKSSMKMADSESARQLRTHIQGILGSCKIAIAVCPVEEREQIISISGRLISSIFAESLEAPVTVYFDEGIKTSKLDLPEGVKVVHGCDSKKVAGIQVADCAAHLVSMLLLSELGIMAKTVPATTVYPDDAGDIELAWTLWATVRYALSSGNPVGGTTDDGWCEPVMHPYGLLVSESCSEEVKVAARNCLGSVWVGCIH